MSSAASLATLASEVVEFVLSFHDSVTLARASSSSRALRDAAEAAAARALAARFARAHPDPSVLRRHALWFGERAAGLCTACRGAGWSGCEHCAATGFAADRVFLVGGGGAKLRPRELSGEYAPARARVVGGVALVCRGRHAASPHALRTTMIRRSRVADDRFGWWITSGLALESLLVPGDLFFYANPAKGADVPVGGWEFHRVLANGRGWTKEADACGPAPKLLYRWPEPCPPPAAAHNAQFSTAASPSR